MQIIVEITYYPLSQDYSAKILDFTHKLQSHNELDVTTGQTATIIRGDYDTVFSMLQSECRAILGQEVRTALVLKILNTV